MLELHREKPILFVNGKEISLSEAEYWLLLVFCAMGDKLISYGLLLEVGLDYSNPLQEDRHLITKRISRLRAKAGVDFIQNKRELGYRLYQEIRIVD